jgi:hypothetical protein
MEEYFLFLSTISRPNIKLVENSHLTTALVVTLNVNHEEHVLRARIVLKSVIFKMQLNKAYIKSFKLNKSDNAYKRRGLLMYTLRLNVLESLFNTKL